MGAEHLYPYVNNATGDNRNKHLESSNFVVSDEDLRQSLSPKSSKNYRNSQICTLSELKEDRVLQASINSQQTAFHMPN